MQTVRNRLRSFRFAFNGILAFLRSEPNARIHLAATIVVVALACWLRCTLTEWILLTLAMALVWITEMLNTAIEKIMDHLSPEHHPAVKWIKDVAAGAVLAAAIAAAVTGALIFVPKFC
ncbi:diacylglycerol kinase family protein [Chitinophaga sp.]|uniref:diacylglycerol kinase family protein n=1 Tax=Chitinophaga sp. TaxID=1869181 RepID=UPI0031E329BE